MKAVFSIIIFILFLIIAIIIIGFVFSSFFGVSFFGGGGGGTGGGFLVSEDKGKTWEARNTISEKQDISRIDIMNLYLEPQDPGTLYLGTKGNGLFKGINGGRVWAKVEDKDQVLDPRADVYQTAKESGEGKNMYLAVYQEGSGRILKSEDEGESFKQVYIVSAGGEQVSGVLVDWFSPSIVYAGTSSGLLLKSYDFGESWQKVWEFQAPVERMFINPHDSREIYIITFSRSSAGKLFKSRDGGKSWDDLTESLKGFKGASNITDLVFDLSSPGILYLASEFGLLKSNDQGATFSEVVTIIPSESLPVLSVAIDPADSNIIYLTAKNQFYKSEDGGKNWQVKVLLTNQNAKILKINPQNSNILYMALGSSPVGKTKSLF